MTSTYVLDACAIIAFLNDEKGGTEVERLLRAAKSGECVLLMNKVNLLEIYHGVFRQEGASVADDVLDLVLRLPIKFIHGLDDAVFREAGRLKASYRISLADAIAIAEAKTRAAALVSADHHEFDPIEKREDLTMHWVR